MQNKQAQAAGSKADEIIQNLANPAQAIETEHSTVEVLDQVKPVATPEDGQRAQAPTDEGNWETRFKNYKASTDNTLHTLRKQVSEFDIMQTENEQLKRKLGETQAQIPTTPNEMLELFSQEEVDGFNKMLDGRVSGLQNEVERLQNELGKVKEAEQETIAQRAHQSVVNAVASAVPNYQEIDHNPAFAEWMDSPDEYGNVRLDMLRVAKNSSPPDIGRIVQFYVDFANENKVEEPTPQNTQYTQQELLQTPNSTPAPRVETPQGKGIVWDAATVSKLYADRALGKISLKLFKELEEDLFSSKK